MVLSHVALDWLWHCLSVFLWLFLILHWIECDIVYLCVHGSSSCCIGLIVTLFICVLIRPRVALNWLWHCLSVFLWFSFMLHWIDCDIVILCFHGSSSCCLGLIVISFFLCFHSSSSWCYWFIVTLFIFVLMVLPRVALNWLWHCLSVFLWVFLMLHWIDCDIVLWFFLMLHWIDCDIFFLCSHGSSSCCIGLIATLFICVFMGLSYVTLEWLWHCLSVFSWFFLMLPWIHCYIVCLCSYGSSSCCIGLIVILFFCVLMVLPHVALNWLWGCLSVFSWFFLMLHWIDCDMLICVLVPLPHVVFDWLWYCLSVFSWFFLMLLLIDCGIVYLCSHWSSSCSIVLIVTVLICVLLFFPFFALNWLWHWLSVFLLFFLMLNLIDCNIVYLCFHGSSSCCIGLIVALVICVPIGFPHVAFYW